jgi:predicted NUDIX family phosphoesterase
MAPDGTLLFLVYQRNKLNNEGQLTMKLSLAPAGHVTNPDVKNYFTVDQDRDPLETEIICLSETLSANLVRESAEEFELTSEAFNKEPQGGRARLSLLELVTSNAYPIGFVMDSKPDPKFVGNIHFGAIFASFIPYADTTFEMKEVHNTAVGWANAVQLLAHINGTESISEGAFFEPWSTMIIQNIAEVVGTIKAASGL